MVTLFAIQSVIPSVLAVSVKGASKLPKIDDDRLFVV